MKISAVFHAMYYALVTLIFSFAAFFAVSLLPIKGNYIVLTVLSGSMEPTIKTGSIVAIKPAPAYKTGDIVTYGAIGRNKIPITHRIREVKVINGKTFFATKGDANQTADSVDVPEDSVHGKVFLTLPYAGYAITAAQKPIGFLLIIAVPLSLIISEEVISIKKQLNKDKETKLEARRLAENKNKDNPNG